MQPTYLPWLGYFDLMDSADIFVLLDDVQFSPKSWQQRNRIRTDKGLEWLTLPVKGQFGRRINEVELSEKPFAEHLRKIREAYTGSTYFNNLIYCLESVYSILDSDPNPILSDINRFLILSIASNLDIATDVCGHTSNCKHTKIVMASSLGVGGTRSERLANICRAVGCDQYLSPPGSVGYLHDEILAFGGIDVFVQNYVHPTYNQLHAPFIPYASAIDAVFDSGHGAAMIMRYGRYPMVPIAEWDSAGRAELELRASSGVRASFGGGVIGKSDGLATKFPQYV